jgi:hypothetical protein
MSRLQDIEAAVNRFEINISSASFEEGYDQLAQEIMNIRFNNIRTMISTGVVKTDDEELIKVIQHEFDEIDKIYRMVKKAGRLGDVKPNQKFGEQLLETIKKKKSTVGEIVRVVPINQPKE